MRFIRLRLRYSVLAAALPAAIFAAPGASAQGLSALCGGDAGHPIVVLQHGGTASPLTASMGAGGGLAAVGVKNWALSNTIETDDALRMLRSVYPSFATPEAATVLQDVIRSRAFRAGSIAMMAYGAYLVIDGWFGTSQPTPGETVSDANQALTLLALRRHDLRPCHGAALPGLVRLAPESRQALLPAHRHPTSLVPDSTLSSILSPIAPSPSPTVRASGQATALHAGDGTRDWRADWLKAAHRKPLHGLGTVRLQLWDVRPDGRTKPAFGLGFPAANPPR